MQKPRRPMSQARFCLSYWRALSVCRTMMQSNQSCISVASLSAFEYLYYSTYRCMRAESCHLLTPAGPAARLPPLQPLDMYARGCLQEQRCRQMNRNSSFDIDKGRLMCTTLTFPVPCSAQTDACIQRKAASCSHQQEKSVCPHTPVYQLECTRESTAVSVRLSMHLHKRKLCCVCILFRSTCMTSVFSGDLSTHRMHILPSSYV